MKKFIRLFLRHWAKTPFKITMTIIAVALGTGIIILSFSASSLLQKHVSDQLDNGGIILYTGNGEWNTDGNLEQERPTEWDAAAPALVVTDIDDERLARAACLHSPEEAAKNGVELIYQNKYVNRREVQRDIFEYIEIFYNRERLHSSLGY